MLTDPQSVTVNAVAQSLPRVSSNGTSAIYQKADQTFKLEVSHMGTKKGTKTRKRSLVRFTERAVVADPLTAVNDYDTAAISIVIERPEFGFTTTRIDQLWAGLKAAIDSAMITKLCGDES